MKIKLVGIDFDKIVDKITKAEKSENIVEANLNDEKVINEVRKAMEKWKSNQLSNKEIVEEYEVPLPKIIKNGKELDLKDALIVGTRKGYLAGIFYYEDYGGEEVLFFHAFDKMYPIIYDADDPRAIFCFIPCKITERGIENE